MMNNVRFPQKVLKGREPKRPGTEKLNLDSQEGIIVAPLTREQIDERVDVIVGKLNVSQKPDVEKSTAWYDRLLDDNSHRKLLEDIKSLRKVVKGNDLFSNQDSNFTKMEIREYAAGLSKTKWKKVNGDMNAHDLSNDIKKTLSEKASERQTGRINERSYPAVSR